MPTPAILRDESDLRRVLAATKHVERQFNGEGLVATPSGFPTDPGMPMAVVRVVSSSPTAGGYWEGQIEAMAAGLHGIASVTAVPTWAPVEDAPVWVRESNNQPLIQDNRYLCTICQVYQGDSVAVTTAGGGGGGLRTENLDTTDQDLTTTDIRADQTTFIEFESVAGIPAYQKLKLNTAGLCADETFVDCITSNLDFTVTGKNLVCVEGVLTKTRKTLASGESVLDNVTLVMIGRFRNDTHVRGTGIGATGPCVAMPTCCPTGITAVEICSGTLTVSTTLQVTVSGGPTFNIVYDAGAGWWTGFAGDSTFCTAADFGLTLTPNCDGTWNVIAVASFKGPANINVTPTSTSPFLYTATAIAESGICGGTVTFTIDEV